MAKAKRSPYSAKVTMWTPNERLEQVEEYANRWEKGEILYPELEALRDAAYTFIAKCDDGRARSTETYHALKAALSLGKIMIADNRGDDKCIRATYTTDKNGAVTLIRVEELKKDGVAYVLR